MEACWPVGPGRLEEAAAVEEQMEAQEEVVGEKKQEKEVGACCREKGREERRMKKQTDGGWRFGAPLSCEARERCSIQPVWGGSMSASGRLTSLIVTLGRENTNGRSCQNNQRIVKIQKSR